MAFRNSAYWKSMLKQLRGGASFSTWTSPKLKAYAPTADDFHPSPGGLKSKFPHGNFVPVLVSMGMIATSVGLGVFTAVHQLGRAPNVHVKKSRRETLPELVAPEQVADEAEKFVKKSFFRKVAHVQEGEQSMPDPMRGEVFNRPLHVETLKDIGVNPTLPKPYSN